MKEFEAAFPVRHAPTQDELIAASAKALGVGPAQIDSCSIIRRSLDARSRDILYRYRIVASLKGEPRIPSFIIPPYQDVSSSEPVIIIGAGPAGLFAALTLLQKGFKPLILERGQDVHKRKYDIASLSAKGNLNPESNYCFGEGGAGTFSDGKLFTRSSKRGNVSEVLGQFVMFGADESILIDAHPHIGTDKLPRIIENIRNCIIEHGGEYHFGCRVVDLDKTSNGWKISCKEGGSKGLTTFASRNVILASGHSASELYELLARKGWPLQSKGFALGVRVEHPQMLINQIQYHNRYQSYLPPAEYSLVEQVDGRGVFSFCMCPGGIVVPSSTSTGEIVLNGMSNSARNSKWANAGIVVSIEPEDIQASSPLAMLEFQHGIEVRTFDFSSSLKAPAQRMTDFVNSKMGTLPQTSYHPGAISAPIKDILPSFVADRLKKAFLLFDKKMKGFYTSEALLLAVESRTSSTVRIPRDAGTLEYVAFSGLYPCGEGAGYSGGIVSSALDGIAAANAVASKIC